MPSKIWQDSLSHMCDTVRDSLIGDAPADIPEVTEKRGEPWIGILVSLFWAVVVVAGAAGATLIATAK